MERKKISVNYTEQTMMYTVTVSDMDVDTIYKYRDVPYSVAMKLNKLRKYSVGKFWDLIGKYSFEKQIRTRIKW